MEWHPKDERKRSGFGYGWNDDGNEYGQSDDEPNESESAGTVIRPTVNWQRKQTEFLSKLRNKNGRSQFLSELLPEACIRIIQ